MEMSRLTSRPDLYSPEKESRCPSNRRLGGPNSRFGRLGEKKSLAPTEIRTPDRPVRSLVVRAATLQWDIFDKLRC